MQKLHNCCIKIRKTTLLCINVVWRKEIGIRLRSHIWEKCNI